MIANALLIGENFSVDTNQTSNNSLSGAVDGSIPLVYADDIYTDLSLFSAQENLLT